ncbi:hypothetical protein BJV77DRAFT_1072339 [Russula vinacea]|nr:hypothetical protein BJV77DRAFT_1072339 [Russula vinacea]
MSSSDVQPTNGHVHADNTTLCDVEATSSNPIEPSDRPEHEDSEQVRSAQPEAPVLGDSPAGQSPVKPKPLASPSKRPTPTAPATTKAASGPLPPSLTSGKFSSSMASSAPAKAAVPQRASVVSPESTASAKSATTPRPRASVSGAVNPPKKAAAPRSSLAPSASSTARPARAPGAGSISSLKEAKELKTGGTDLLEVQSKLDEATASLDLKTSTISELETQVEWLKASLDSINADLEAAQQNLEGAKLAKATADKELAEARDALVMSQGDRHKLEHLSDELETARTTTAERNAVIDALREQIKALEAQVDESRKTLEALRADYASDSGIIAAAETAQAEALEAATAKISALELQASSAEGLATEIATLRAEKERTSNKLSELEVEILELKEAHDLAVEERGNSETQINSLREEVARLPRPPRRLFKRLQKSRVPPPSIGGAPRSQAEVDGLRNDLEVVNVAAASAAKEHGVKDEHEQRLQQAFERAKNEAGDAHTQDLQVLREKSEEATEQLRASHQATVEGLKTDHEAALASQVQTFQKQLASQALELKATAEDLAKAKAMQSTSRQEMETLKTQLDEARQAALATASAAAADKDAEIERLTKELSNVREDLNGVNEVYHVARDSMQEMNNNHKKELEEAAKGRADEVSKLRAAHDVELQSLLTDKAGLVSKLSTSRASCFLCKPLCIHRDRGVAQRNGAPQDERLAAQHDKELRALQEQVDARTRRQDQEESQDQITKYVKLFGFKSFLGSIFALAVIIGSGIF